MSAQSQPRLTPEEYLALDRAAEFRSEYYDGTMYAMSGASYVHGIIVGNLARAVGNALMGRGCGVVPNDLRVRLSSRAYAYPDLVITCGPPRLEDDRKDILLNPTFLLEVLSPSTETYDRGLKFSYYQQLESLQEYVLVSQTQPRIEIYRRQVEGKWLYSDVRGLESICRFDSLDCSIPFSDIYYQVSFDPLP